MMSADADCWGIQISRLMLLTLRSGALFTQLKAMFLSGLISTRNLIMCRIYLRIVER